MKATPTAITPSTSEAAATAAVAASSVIGRTKPNSPVSCFLSLIECIILTILSYSCLFISLRTYYYVDDDRLPTNDRYYSYYYGPLLTSIAGTIGLISVVLLNNNRTGNISRHDDDDDGINANDDLNAVQASSFLKDAQNIDMSKKENEEKPCEEKKESENEYDENEENAESVGALPTKQTMKVRHDESRGVVPPPSQLQTRCMKHEYKIDRYQTEDDTPKPCDTLTTDNVPMLLLPLTSSPSLSSLIRTRGGVDPNGIALGSSLVPTLFCAITLAISVMSKSNERTVYKERTMLVPTTTRLCQCYTNLVSLVGLAYSISSLLCYYYHHHRHHDQICSEKQPPCHQWQQGQQRRHGSTIINPKKKKKKRNYCALGFLMKHFSTLRHTAITTAMMMTSSFSLTTMTAVLFFVMCAIQWSVSSLLLLPFHTKLETSTTMIIIFAAIQTTLCLMYDNNNLCTTLIGSRHKQISQSTSHQMRTISSSSSSSSSLSLSSSFRTSPIQKVFTPGEWMAVSALLSVVLTDFVTCYTTTIETTMIFPSVNREMNKQEMRELQRRQSFPPIHLIVSQSGLIGCMFGCVVVVVVGSGVVSFIPRFVEHWNHYYYRHQNDATNKPRFRAFVTMGKLIVIASFALGFVEYALRHFTASFCSLGNGNNNYDYVGLCGGGDDNDGTVVGGILNTLNVGTSVDGSIPYHERIIPYVPQSISWLMVFLLTSEETSTEQCHVPILNEGWNNSKMGVFIAQVMCFIKTQPRGMWLLYWFVILLVCSPMALCLAKRLDDAKKGRSTSTSTSSVTLSDIKVKQNTVVARKFFHLVAVALFVPPTFLAPDMMSLSYAVAISLLFVVETLRVGWSGKRSSSDKRVCDDSEERGAESSERGTVQDVENNDVTMTAKKASSFNLNDFYEAFFDEKDTGGKEGGFVVTHVALICGCAVPLWIHEFLFYHLNNYDATVLSVMDTQQRGAFRLLPFIGILTLGVGDAAGALVGIYFGRTRWPGSKRTVEGSIAMFLSMVFCAIVLLSIHDALDIEVGISCIGTVAGVLAILTLLEASTSQIDNICLPLSGVIILLIQFTSSHKL